MRVPSIRRSMAIGVCWAVLAFVFQSRGLAQDPGIQILYDFAQLPGHPAARLVKAPDGTLCGTAVMNPPTQPGGVFCLRPRDDGSYEYRLLHRFLSTQGGRHPYGGLALASDGHLYGTTRDGGANDAGTVFRVTADGLFTSLHSFDGASGRIPMGTLVQGADGHLYGTTVAGGRYGLGTIFRITTGGAFTLISSFWWYDGAAPTAGLIRASDGNFYGTATSGGFSSAGTIFRMTPAGVVTPLHYFTNANGRRPVAALTEASDGNLYGTTYEGGATNFGTVFRISTGGSFTSLHTFPSFDGRPTAGLVQSADGYLYGAITGGAQPGYDESQHPGALFRISVAGSFETVHTFNVHDGKLPLGTPIEGSDGALYGGTIWGGAERHGSIYRFTPEDGITTVHSFTGRVKQPEGLVLARDGNFYGVDRSSGPRFTGTIFKLAPDGTYTPLYTPLVAEGTTVSPLMQAADGNLYGTTRLGGANGSGIVFRITYGGQFTIVASFGRFDGIAGLPLVQAADGTFYGSMEYGENNAGSVFRMTSTGDVSTVHAFTGQLPGMNAIILAADGHLYGTMEHGGPNQLGTVFRVSTAGMATTLHTFTGGADGSRPVSRLAQGPDGDLYGTTLSGGAANSGTVFRISATGALTTLHSFAIADGRPRGPLHAASDGYVYGTTTNSADSMPRGTVFRISPATGAVTTVHTFAADDSEGTPISAGVVEGPDGAIYGTTSKTISGISGGPQGAFYRLGTGSAFGSVGLTARARASRAPLRD
jgi:uncharacterized repeat protein (TIGR03803 family)